MLGLRELSLQCEEELVGNHVHHVAALAGLL